MLETSLDQSLALCSDRRLAAELGVLASFTTASCTAIHSSVSTASIEAGSTGIASIEASSTTVACIGASSADFASVAGNSEGAPDTVAVGTEASHTATSTTAALVGADQSFLLHRLD